MGEYILAALPFLVALVGAMPDLFRAWRQKPVAKTEKMLTLGQVAKHFGVRTWQVDRLFSRKLLPEPQRVGILRVIPESQLPDVEKALRAGGYLK